MISSFALVLGSRSAASFRGFRSPPTIASMMVIPVLPVMLLMTCCSLTFIWVSAFCMCWM